MTDHRTRAVVAPLGAVVATAVMCGAAACARAPEAKEAPPPIMSGPLIAAHTTMVTAWELPKNPLTDPALGDSTLAKEIRWGFRIFTNTPVEAARFTPGKMSCSNCHLNAGQREKSLPLVHVAGMFPEYNRRAARLFTLVDRILDCFYRSQNAAGRHEEPEHLPAATSKEVLALAAYITWLGRGGEVGTGPAWRGQNVIPAANLIPVAKLDPAKGEAIFTERCTNCHGPDGQGVAIGDKKPAPLWGPESWNDGAGAARVYTLAGFIRHAMPYLDPGSLTDEEAQQVASFITSKPRPSYPFKHEDYLVERLPPDAVYYPPRPAVLTGLLSPAPGRP